MYIITVIKVSANFDHKFLSYEHLKETYTGLKTMYMYLVVVQNGICQYFITYVIHCKVQPRFPANIYYHIE